MAQITLGIGAYYYDLSDTLQNSLDPLVNFHDESTIEAYYSWAMKSWLQLGADIQYIDPASGNNKKGVGPVPADANPLLVGCCKM